jgi:hypothetical protein
LTLATRGAEKGDRAAVRGTGYAMESSTVNPDEPLSEQARASCVNKRLHHLAGNSLRVAGVRSAALQTASVGSDAVRRAFITVILVALASAAAAETQQHVILRDGQPVGSYRLAFSRSGDDLTVDGELSVDLRAGVFLLFAYRHTAREVWRGDRLIAFDSATYDNGKRLRVTGRASADGFLVDGMDGGAVLPVDIRPTSFWRQDTIAQSRLLDAETGRVLNVAATPIMDEPSAGSHSSARQRYRLSGQLKHDLELCYDGGRWVSARFRMLGSDIEIRPQDPAAAPKVAIAR